MSSHFCSASFITDLLACQQCGTNQICCKQCFAAKHRGLQNRVHVSCKLVDSDVYKNFLKVIHVEWLVGHKLLKSLGGFEVTQENKECMVNAAFYGSQFYNQFFKDESSITQYMILKSYYSNSPKSFESLSSVQKLLNDVKSLDIISRHISKLTQPTEEQKVMNSHLDFYIGADIYYLGQFFVKQQEEFDKYLFKIKESNQEFNIYKYIELREKTERNETYYSNEFTAFLIEYYRKNSHEKGMFLIQDYILNYWQFFNRSVQINPTIREFFNSEISFYRVYEKLMEESKMTVSYLGFKIWKLNNGVSRQLPYLKNHYFLFAFVEGYIKMLIERTYAFLTNEQKEEFANQNWQEFAKFIRDYSLLVQERNQKKQIKQGFDFDIYKNYYLYRQRMQKFHNIIKSSPDNIYDKEVAVRFFNHYFQTNVQFKLKLYKEFFEKCQTEKKNQEEKIAKEIDELKQQLLEEEKDQFYQFIFLNFIIYCKEQQISIKKQTYHNFKKGVFQTMDQYYLRQTEERFRRGDFNEPVQEEEQQVPEQKTEQPKVLIGQTGAKITIGIDKFEEQILQSRLQENEQQEDELIECPCCHNEQNCNNQDCAFIGYCMYCAE